MKPQQPLLGFLFALTTAMAWGSLPLALKQLTKVMSVETIVWYRFLTAAVGLLLVLGLTKKLPKLTALWRYRWLLLFGIFGLASNFILYNSSLAYIQPTTAQVLGQLSPFVMMLCGVWLFKEVIGVHHKIGLVILVIGLLLFFNDKFSQLVSLNQYSLGILLGVSASTIWVCYGIAQKLMLAQFNSMQILLVIYCGCALLFSPLANPIEATTLSPFLLGCLLFCCCNTLIGYGAYAEALNRWDVSKVSIVVTLTPLFTILFSDIFHFLDPEHFDIPELNGLSYIGASLVVSGAMIAAVGHKLFYRRRYPKTAHKR